MNDEEALWVLDSAEALTDNCGVLTWGSDMLQSKMHVPANYLTRIRTTSKEEHCDKYYCTRDECTAHDEDSRNYIRLCNYRDDYNGKKLNLHYRIYFMSVLTRVIHISKALQRTSRNH